MQSINQAMGWGFSMSQYYNNMSGYNFKTNYEWPTSPNQGARGLWGVTNKSWVYIYGQGGTFGSPNGYTNIYYNSYPGQGAQSIGTVNLQTYQGARCWVRNYAQHIGSGGAGGQGGLSGPGQGGFAGGAAFNIQGYSGDFRLNSQGYYVVGGGGGGSGGNQGSSPNQGRYDSQYSPSGGGGGGGGAGYGAGGNRPDARYQGQAGNAGGTYTAGTAGAGGNRAGPGAPGGNAGVAGGNAARPGGAAGQQISGSYYAIQVQY